MIGIDRRFLRDETGATAIEYGLIAAAISLANTKFTAINSSLRLGNFSAGDLKLVS